MNVTNPFWTKQKKEKKSISLSPKAILLISWAILIAVSIATLVLGYLAVSRYIIVQKKSLSLSELSYYPNRTESLSGTNAFLKDQNSFTLIEQIMPLYKTKESDAAQMQLYFNNIQRPYENLLQYFLLPPLNIWKDKYTGQIDDSLIGKKYLEENAYLDVNLISQWTDFFKNIWQDSQKNEIDSINVGGINETSDGVFSVPITVSFTAQTKRSFLLLVDKLSVTSNRENISLINGFFFNLRNTLRETYPNDTDAVIGENVYKWVYDEESTYVSSGDIEDAIYRAASCTDEGISEACYFSFREKMRSIPSLAYTVWLSNSNKANELRTFLQELPPMIVVKSFVFQKQADGSYKGDITMDAYGKSMSEAELQQIATYLGEKCARGLVLSPSVAISQLDEVIRQATSVSQISNEKSKDLDDLRDIFDWISKSYDWLPGFQKAVQLFSIYRMLSENNMCK